jgi:hypothetical protein
MPRLLLSLQINKQIASQCMAVETKTSLTVVSSAKISHSFTDIFQRTASPKLHSHETKQLLYVQLMLK